MITTVLLSICGYFLFTLWAGWNDVLSAALRVGAGGMLLVLFLSLCNYALRYIRWRLYLKQQGHTIPWASGLRIYLSGFALTITPGKSGEAIRGVYLKEYDVPFRKSFGVFFAERASDLFSDVLLASSGLWIYPKARPILLILAGLFALLFFILRKEQWLKKIGSLFPKKLAHFADYLLEISSAFRNCFHSSALLTAVILGLVAWAAEGAALYSLLNILGYQIPLLTVFFIYGFSLVIGGITLLPGGLGGAEIAMLELLQLQQVNASDAVAITLIIRLTTLWFSVFLGMLAFPQKRGIVSPLSH